jgi:hypothetical protein
VGLKGDVLEAGVTSVVQVVLGGKSINAGESLVRATVGAHLVSTAAGTVTVTVEESCGMTWTFLDVTFSPVTWSVWTTEKCPEAVPHDVSMLKVCVSVAFV